MKEIWKQIDPTGMVSKIYKISENIKDNLKMERDTEKEECFLKMKNFILEIGRLMRFQVKDITFLKTFQDIKDLSKIQKKRVRVYFIFTKMMNTEVTLKMELDMDQEYTLLENIRFLRKNMKMEY